MRPRSLSSHPPLPTSSELAFRHPFHASVDLRVEGCASLPLQFAWRKRLHVALCKEFSMVRGIVFAVAAVEPPRQKISRPACQHRIRGGYCNAPRSARDPEGGWVARNCSALMEVFLKTPFTLKGANSPGRSGMDVNSADAALVVIDPQNDVLSENGVSWS